MATDSDICDNPLWGTRATRYLIHLWSYKKIRTQLESSRNRRIWEMVARAVNKKCDPSANFTYQQCKTKIKTLKARYFAEKKARDKFGRNPHYWTHWADMNKAMSIVGIKPNLSDSLVNQDTARGSEVTASSTQLISGCKGQTGKNQEIQDHKETCGITVETVPVQSGKKAHSWLMGDSATESTSPKFRKRSRKSPKLYTLLISMMEMLKKSEDRFFELEEKRLKFEMEISHKRLDQEREYRKNMLDTMSKLMQYEQTSSGPNSPTSSDSGSEFRETAGPSFQTLETAVGTKPTQQFASSCKSKAGVMDARNLASESPLYPFCVSPGTSSVIERVIAEENEYDEVKIEDDAWN